MAGGDFFVYLIENTVFWGFVYIIVFMGCETPAIIFTGFGFFLFYWILRAIARQEKWGIWLYALNMLVTIMLLFYFTTGFSLQKGIRSFLNSATRRYPNLDPYLKRC